MESSLQDLFVEALQKTKKELEECQENMRVKSCLECDKMFDCELRKRYIDSVYKSMNKGKSGGFEF